MIIKNSSALRAVKSKREMFCELQRLMEQCLSGRHAFYSAHRVPYQIGNIRFIEPATATKPNNTLQIDAMVIIGALVGSISSLKITSGQCNCPLVLFEILRFYVDYASQRVHFQSPGAANGELLEFRDGAG